MGNMYGDSIYQWNCFVGCEFDCVYCRKSFQAQMKRQKPIIDKNGKERGCQLCYEYKPHFHPERLNNRLPKTKGDEFIWACSSGDIYFANKEWINKILARIKTLPDRTFFFQTKYPICFYNWNFPENVILGITLESYEYHHNISLAPNPHTRMEIFKEINHPRKIITIEPILDFPFVMDFVYRLIWLKPERIYIGYDTKKNRLPEPSLNKTKKLISTLKEELPECKIKEKLIRKAWWEK